MNALLRASLASLAVVVASLAWIATTASAAAEGTKTCGEGVCKKTVGASESCVPGTPVSANESWLSKADSETGSWDANCDGKVEKKPAPKELYDGAFVMDCETKGSACIAKKRTEFACGEKVHLFEKCAVDKDDGKCKPGGETKGLYVQYCR